MNGPALEKTRSSRKEKWIYAIAFGVIAVMLYVVGFPIFILLFLGVLAFFIWRAFSSATDNETKQIFDFYLKACEILRQDDRRWFGFEVHDAIARGENLVAKMTAPPPLVYFALGALHRKAGDHAAAIKYLEQVCGENAADEMSIVYPSKEFREYVRILRKIERAPAEAPLTSAAVRLLERTRKNRGREMLEASRLELNKQTTRSNELSAVPSAIVEETHDEVPVLPPKQKRSTISEVLHDVYDTNIQ